MGGEAAGPEAGVRGMVCQEDLFCRVVGGEEIEDEADGLIPSHGEEAVHHTDEHDLLTPAPTFCLCASVSQGGYGDRPAIISSRRLRNNGLSSG